MHGSVTCIKNAVRSENAFSESFPLFPAKNPTAIIANRISRLLIMRKISIDHFPRTFFTVQKILSHSQIYSTGYT